MKTLVFVGAFYGILKGNVLQKRTLSKEIWPNVARQCALCGRNGRSERAACARPVAIDKESQ